MLKLKDKPLSLLTFYAFPQPVTHVSFVSVQFCYKPLLKKIPNSVLPKGLRSKYECNACYRHKHSIVYRKTAFLMFSLDVRLMYADTYES